MAAPTKKSIKKLFNRVKRLRRGALGSGFRNFGPIDHDPLISVIIVSYDSTADLPACLESISKQSYQKLEVIVAENGEQDTRPLVKSAIPKATWIKMDKNRGFASGNNRALEVAKGEFVALVNPDARLDEDCILELLRPFFTTHDLATTAPKTRFWTKFIDLHLVAESEFIVDLTHINDDLRYPKYFIKSGILDSGNHNLSSIPLGTDSHQILLRLPVDGSTVELRIEGTREIKVHTHSLGWRTHRVSARDMSLKLQLDAGSHPSAFWVVNNAGSDVGNQGPFDVGFSEKDEFNYDATRFLEAFCGCVALIRRSALIGRPLFRPEFFAYYEDSELSHYFRKHGYRIQYTPRALAYHKHSSTTSEGSIKWKTLVQRSKLIYDVYTDQNKARDRFNEFVKNPNRYNTISNNLQDLLTDLDSNAFASSKSGRTIGVYNLYWTTLGGGEAHALGVALSIAASEDEIYLLSETDFSIHDLEIRFGFDLSRVRKLIVREMTREYTKSFDVFINATFSSNFRSAAKTSLYIVSFPHKGISEKCATDYYFLFNSRFTQRWAERIWPRHSGTVVYPTLHLKSPEYMEIPEKSKLILTLGRITDRGHAKNQHSIIEAFISTAQHPELRDWRLAVVGSAEDQDAAYLEKIKSLAATDDRIEVVVNATRTVVETYLKMASIYVHATGLGMPPDEPERHEHFGIAPFEGCLYGAWPIVYAIGGPADLTNDLGIGAVFSNVSELKKELLAAMLDKKKTLARDPNHAAKAFCEENRGHLNKIYKSVALES